MEADFLHWLREQLPEHRQVLLGPGDDAAVVRLAQSSDLVVTSDLLTDGVDFLLEECGPLRVGRKSLAVNLSDLAAMASRPVAIIVSLALPHTTALATARGFFKGLLPLAEEYDVAIAGGDTNTWEKGLVVSITALGETTAAGALTRSGAQVGDQILVTGDFGGSILGKHLDFEPRVREALLLQERYELHAGIDVSDGLSLDLSRLAASSRCGAAIELDRVPVAQAAEQLSNRAGDKLNPLEHALSDGEDFELIIAAPPAAAEQILADQPLQVPVTMIGEVVEQPGLWQRTSMGQLQWLEARGYEHQ
jgi:thiamine-monophosphate kinase